MNVVDSVFSLFESLDKEKNIPYKLKLIMNWAEMQPEIHNMRIVSFDRSHISPGSDVVYIPQPKDTQIFPQTPAIINGKSPVPPHLFPQEHQKEVTVYFPIRHYGGDLAGALLLKTDSPKRFLKGQQSTLGIIASKTHDLFEILNLRNRSRGSDNQDNASDVLTQDILSKLMDLLKLPMYITDRNGRFIKVNDVFLKKFKYNSLEELNSGTDFFVSKDNWSNGIETLTDEDDTKGLTMHVRSGIGEICVVRDFATLIGKNTFGVLLDITKFININEELEDSLETQKLLNERLKNTTSVLQKTQATAMKSLAALAEYRDKETGNHLRRICEYSRVIGREINRMQPFHFNISDEYVDDMFISSMLHDIGKVGVPDNVLLKPGPLSRGEWDTMKRHTEWGWIILNQADHELGEQSFLTLSSRIALYHHERYDGTGYPKGIKGEDIPLSARISAIADVYDALTSKRPYKEAWTHEQALDEMLNERAKHFDPVLIDMFQDTNQEFADIKQEFAD